MPTAQSKLEIIIDIIGGDSSKINKLEGSLSNLSSNVAQYKRQLDAATPQNLRFAQTFEQIKADVESGKLSIDQARQSIDKLNAEMKETQPKAGLFDKIKSGWKGIAVGAGIATAAYYTISRAAQAAYRTISEGAGLELAERKFDRLAKSIGTSAQVLRMDLHIATQGLLSDADSMQLAGDLMSLGLAKTREEAIRLTNVAAQLGMNMNQLVLTLTNQTTMRFDALGVAVDGFDEKVKKLEAAGMSADDAFKWAFIQQAEDQIEKVGSISDTTAGSLQKLEAQWENLTNRAKMFAAEVAGPTINAMATQTSAQDALNWALEHGLTNQEEINRLTAEGGTATEIAARMLEMVAEKQKYYNMRLEEGTSLLNENVPAIRENAQLTEQMARSKQILSDTDQNAVNAANMYNASLFDQNEALKEQNQRVNSIAASYSSLSTSIGESTQKYREQIEWLQSGGIALAGMDEQLKKAINAGDWDLANEITNQMTKLDIDMKLESDDINVTEAAARLVEELGITPEEAKSMVKEMETTLAAITSKQYILEFKVNADWSALQYGRPSVNVSGGTSGDTEWASGTGGWMKVPGPTGAPVPVTVHGGEMMNVVPAGQSGGGSGGNVNWYGDAIFTSAEEAFAFVAGMGQSASRNAASARAGSGYIG